MRRGSRLLALLYLLAMLVPGSVSWCSPACGDVALGISGSSCASGEDAPACCACRVSAAPGAAPDCCQEWDDAQQAHLLAEQQPQPDLALDGGTPQPQRGASIPALLRRTALSHGRPFFEPDRARLARGAPLRTVLLRI